jgi:HAD superfamily hydrolase (TIGR01484 family)
MILKYKLIILDIDGTLITQKIPLDKRLTGLLSEYMKQGGKVVLLSGRLPGGMVQIAKQLNLPDGTILAGSDGCVFSKFRENNKFEVFKIWSMELDKYSEIFKYYSTGGLILTPDRVIKVGDLHKIMEHLAGITDVNVERIDNWNQFENNQPVVGLRFLLEKNQMKNIEPELMKISGNKIEIFSDNAFSKELTGIAIRPGGVDKGDGVKYLLKLYGLQKKDVISFGDWVTDIPMFINSGFSVVPESSLDIVKEKAKRISTWGIEDGFVFNELNEILN